MHFKEAFLQFQYLFELLRDNPSSLESVEKDKKNKWNAVMDFHLVFEWCFIKYFHRDKSIKVILVTGDKNKNFKDFHERNEDAWDMWQYFEFLGFIVDRTNQEESILYFKKDKQSEVNTD